MVNWLELYWLELDWLELDWLDWTGGVLVWAVGNILSINLINLINPINLASPQ